MRLTKIIFSVLGLLAFSQIALADKKPKISEDFALIGVLGGGATGSIAVVQGIQNGRKYYLTPNGKIKGRPGLRVIEISANEVKIAIGGQVSLIRYQGRPSRGGSRPQFASRPAVEDEPILDAIPARPLDSDFPPPPGRNDFFPDQPEPGELEVYKRAYRNRKANVNGNGVEAPADIDDLGEW